MRNLVGADLKEIGDIIAALNEPAYRARQVYAGIYGRGERAWESFTDLGKALRKKLEERFVIEYPPVLRIFDSKDGTRRHLFELSRDQRIEAVYIPEEKRDTFCISTQVGCAVGCLFCATGRLKMQRNLTPGEIVGQIMALESGRKTDARRRNIVLMGMGEPLHNYDNVMRAIRLMTDDRGMSISHRRITLSTAGIVPAILKLAKEPIIPNLAVSLNATTDPVRDRLIPINRKWNIESLLEACRAFPLEPRRRITFEYVLIGGVNDTVFDAHRLAKLLKGMKKKVNLIPLNAAESISLKPPDPERVLQFQKILIDHHITANIRRSRGADIAAACGMLAGSVTSVGR